MTNSSQNLQMIDFAFRDARSVSAMLRGTGDGREKQWLTFHRKHGAHFREEQLHAMYKEFCRTQSARSDKRVVIGKGILAFGSFMAVVF